MRMSPTGPAQAAFKEFQSRLEHYSSHVDKFEDWDLQEKARSHIPIDELHTLARALIINHDQPGEFEECLLKQLLKWFKVDYFRWMNSPECEQCHVSTEGIGSTAPSTDEKAFGAGHVEVYKCPQCASRIRFPRYNDPSKLMDTRIGRCGEWANVFTLMCRSMGFEARHVYDWTDHVWTEVFLESKNQWVHCDSCEASMDAPLVYESGWGKKVTYCIAFSCDETVDVTRRYTRKYNEVLGRRQQVPEQWLAKCISEMNTKRQSGISDSTRQILCERRRREERELAASALRAPSQSENVGRVSGSLAWRSYRGETGKISSSSSSSPSTDLGAITIDNVILSKVDSNSIAMRGSSFISGNKLTLTRAMNDELGAAWVKQALSSSKSFIVEFSFQVKRNGEGADGFALVFQSHGLDAIGEGGGGLGYHKIVKSVAIEFDMYQSSDTCDDADGNHISVQTRGPQPNSAHHRYSIACASESQLPSLSCGTEYSIIVIYSHEAKTLNLLLTDDTDHSKQRQERNFVDILNVPDFDLGTVIANGYKSKSAKVAPLENVWVGFTGATGGFNQEQVITTLQVSTMCPRVAPPSASK